MSGGYWKADTARHLASFVFLLALHFGGYSCSIRYSGSFIFRSIAL